MSLRSTSRPRKLNEGRTFAYGFRKRRYVAGRLYVVGVWCFRVYVHECRHKICMLYQSALHLSVCLHPRQVKYPPANHVASLVQPTCSETHHPAEVPTLAIHSLHNTRQHHHTHHTHHTTHHPPHHHHHGPNSPRRPAPVRRSARAGRRAARRRRHRGAALVRQSLRRRRRETHAGHLHPPFLLRRLSRVRLPLLSLVPCPLSLVPHSPPPPPSPPLQPTPTTNTNSYLATLAASIQPHELATAQVQLRIVGCGEPSLIARYAAATSCAFEVFSDRSGGVYDALGMGRSLSRGREEPEYISRGTVASVLTSIGQGLRWGAPLGGGDIQRVSLSLCVCVCVCVDARGCSFADARAGADWRRVDVGAGPGAAAVVPPHEEHPGPPGGARGPRAAGAARRIAAHRVGTVAE